MKIAVTGPETTVSFIRRILERDIADVEPVYSCTEFFEETVELADQLQRDKDVDAILFSGPTNYAYTRKRLAPTIPWGYLPHSRTAALQAFLEATTICGNDLKGISVDRYDPSLLTEVLESIGIKDTRFYQAPYDFELPGYEKALLEFHRDCFQQGLTSVCFTSMEHIQAPLQAEGIPCVRTSPAEEIIREQVYLLQIRHFSAQGNHGKLAVISIRYDYIFDDERDLDIRKWEKVRYQNEFKERLFSVAQRMGAAVFEHGSELFFIATSRDMLINGFLRSGAHQDLLQFGRRTPNYKVWVGMGIGSTMLEAKSRASMALNASQNDRRSNSYLVEDDMQLAEVISHTDAGSLEHGSSSFFARRVKVGVDTLERLAQILVRDGNVTTSEELAQKLGITSRSVNRILAQLEEAGCVFTVGKRSSGKGRPARVMKITLPDTVIAGRQERD